MTGVKARAVQVVRMSVKEIKGILWHRVHKALKEVKAILGQLGLKALEAQRDLQERT